VQPKSDSERLRCFIAIDIAAPVCAALRDVIEQFARRKSDVRWVRGDGLHVTLKFLGWIDARRLQQIEAALAQVLRGRPALRVRVRGLGAFPSFRRPRVLWVGLEGDGLGELAACVEQAMNQLGFDPEKRGFTPHITLGRVNGMRGWSHVEDTLKTHLTEDFGESTVEVVTLYRSTLHPDGAIYTPLWTIPLGQNREGASDDNHGC
jgi:2'-5' RNA ligase